jgi:hypothetical protein
MENELLNKLADKTMSKKELFLKVVQDFSLLPNIIDGTSSTKPAIRYGCGKVLMDLSEKYPKKDIPIHGFFH